MNRQELLVVVLGMLFGLLLTVGLAYLWVSRQDDLRVSLAAAETTPAAAQVAVAAVVVTSAPTDPPPTTTMAFTPAPTLAETSTITPEPSPAPTATPRPAASATLRPVIRATATPLPTATPTPAPTRESLSEIITIGDCRAVEYHLGPVHTGLRGGLNSEQAMSLLWTVAECGDLPIARCMVDFFNPRVVILALADGNNIDEAEFYAGHQRVIDDLRAFERSDIDLFVVLGPTTHHVYNPFGDGVVVIDLKDVVDRALAAGIQLLEADGTHLIPVWGPYPEPWMQNYADNLFYHLYHRAIAIGFGVVSIDEDFFETHPYQP
jgi:hypothetical protein